MELLVHRSRVVGVKTLSTSRDGFVHPGGGSLFAAAHALTTECQTRSIPHSVTEHT
jgi:hypothetical protein